MFRQSLRKPCEAGNARLRDGLEPELAWHIIVMMMVMMVMTMVMIWRWQFVVEHLDERALQSPPLEHLLWTRLLACGWALDPPLDALLRAPLDFLDPARQ